MAPLRRVRIRSGLGRPLDLRLASNRLALVVPVTAGMVAGVWALAVGWAVGEALRVGVAAGGASFLAWASGRELDPDHTATAGAAAVLAPWIVLADEPALAAGFLGMLGVRAVVGSTGAAPYPADTVLIGALAAWAALGDRGLAAAMGGLCVFAAATIFDPRGRASTLTLSTVGAATALAVAIPGGRPVAPSGHTPASGWLMAGIVAIAAIALLVRTGSLADRRPVPVSVGRLRWGVVVAAAWALVAVAWHGPIGVAVSGPILVALAATAVRVGFGALTTRR